jgi:hypothetical protein
MPATLRQRGYYMTEDHERRRKADALLALQEAQARYVDRLRVARELGKEFRGLADIVESSNPGNLSVESYEALLNYAHLVGVISDVRKAEVDLQEASAHSAQMNKL